MLDVRGIRPHEKTVPFKLQWASREGGQLATTITYIHHPRETTDTTVNAIFYVHSSVGNRPMNFLLDSGAAISVIHHKHYLIILTLQMPP